MAQWLSGPTLVGPRNKNDSSKFLCEYTASEECKKKGGTKEYFLAFYNL